MHHGAFVWSLLINEANDCRDLVINWCAAAPAKAHSGEANAAALHFSPAPRVRCLSPLRPV